MPERKASWVRPMFDAIAPRYDLLNRLISLGMDHGWRRRAVREALAVEPRVVLDVGTGTGDLALALARGQGSRPRIVGLDFAGAMLKIARQRAGTVQEADRAWFVLGDALHPPLAEGSVDAVVSAFVMRNVDDLPEAFAAMSRVLRRGGRLVILEMTPMRQPLLRALFRLYFNRWVPLLGRMISRHADAYSWLPRSVDEFMSAEALTALIEEAGFADVHVRRLGLGAVALHTATRT